ncbi:DUF2304 family protein [uncultured Methanobacterium sp.]|uniref:DUF2304 domain-containing protein n=1 Tax=uncultured Methanobacterium sp. TaxID=176306 RepID=UPI002AA8ECCB|nr:DUF2304 family protein [uncultured Methanobacterium sp.]
MILYQYIGIIIGIIGILITVLRFKDAKMSFNMLIVWIAIWLLLILFSIDPDTTSTLASITGIGRGLDLILILGLIGCYYFIFKIYNLIENVEGEISSLVREIALDRGQSKNDKKQNKKENYGEDIKLDKP